MTTGCFWGPMAHLPLLQAVLGRAVVAEPCTIAGFALRAAAGGQPWAELVAEPGGAVQGLRVSGLGAEDLARLDYHAAVFGQHRAEVSDAVIWRSDATVLAQVWRAEGWLRDWAATVVATAGDVMALMGERSPAEVAARYRLMLVRGASRVRAAQAAPVTRRMRAGPDDLDLRRRIQPYAHFFAVEEYDLRFRRFDGTMSPEINRAVFLSGDAVTVLPYDPRRDRVLLVEQFRAGIYGRGDPQPWSLEAIAGRVDPDEPPETAARREAVEEAGLTLGALEWVAGYYPSPGAKAEYLYNYVALCDLPDDAAGVFGVEGEAEDIRGHLVDFAEFESMVASGEIQNGPLLITALWLTRERPRLRAA